MAGTPQPACTTAFRGTTWRVVWNSNVYVRAGPSREAIKVNEIPPQSLVTEHARYGDWVYHSHGGWTLAKAGQNVVLEAAFPPPSEDVRFSGTRWRTLTMVDVRQTTDGASQKLLDMTPKTEVVELARDGDWIRHAGGWSLCRTEATQLMEEVQRCEDGVHVGSKWRVVWNTNVYVRSGPARDTPKRAEVPPGRILTELSRHGDWIRHELGWSLSKAGGNICLAPVDTAEQKDHSSDMDVAQPATQSPPQSQQTQQAQPVTTQPPAFSGSVSVTPGVGAGTQSFFQQQPHTPSTSVQPGAPVQPSYYPSPQPGAPQYPSQAFAAPDQKTLQPQSAAGPTPAAAPGGPRPVWRVVWPSNVYVRANPSRDSPKIGELPPNACVLELDRQNDWIKHDKGWTLSRAGHNICLAPENNFGQLGLGQTQPAPIQAPGPQPSPMAVQPHAQEGLYMTHPHPGMQPQSISMNYTSQQEAPRRRQWRVVWATNVYVRSRADRTSDKVAELPPGAVVYELERTGDWVRHDLGWTLAKAGNNICLAPEDVQANR